MSEEITVNLDGRTYSGSFEVSRGIITVTSFHGRKATQVGSTPPRVLARQLLRELVQEDKLRSPS